MLDIITTVLALPVPAHLLGWCTPAGALPVWTCALEITTLEGQHRQDAVDYVCCYAFSNTHKNTYLLITHNKSIFSMSLKYKMKAYLANVTLSFDFFLGDLL